MTFVNKSTAHAVSGSMSGRVEQVGKAVSTDSLLETGRFVKGGDVQDWARRLANMLTERQKRDIARLALVIREAGG